MRTRNLLIVIVMGYLVTVAPAKPSFGLAPQDPEQPSDVMGALASANAVAHEQAGEGETEKGDTEALPPKDAAVEKKRKAAAARKAAQARIARCRRHPEICRQ